MGQLQFQAPLSTQFMWARVKCRRRRSYWTTVTLGLDQLLYGAFTTIWIAYVSAISSVRKENLPDWSLWMKPELSLPSAFSRFLHLARRFWNQTCQHSQTDISQQTDKCGYCSQKPTVKSSCFWTRFVQFYANRKLRGSVFEIYCWQNPQLLQHCCVIQMSPIFRFYNELSNTFVCILIGTKILWFKILRITYKNNWFTSAYH